MMDSGISSGNVSRENSPELLLAEALASQERAMAAALRGVGGVADQTMVARTHRRVREQTIEMAERRSRARHGIGLTILAFSLLLLVLTPVIWSGFHLPQGWEFADFDAQSMCLIGWLFPVTLMGLVLGCMRMRAGRGIRRLDQRVSARLDSLVR
ncbi:MAG: hypothetical protein ABI064_04735 [Acidobacteriaceae bacterium]